MRIKMLFPWMLAVCLLGCRSTELTEVAPEAPNRPEILQSMQQVMGPLPGPEKNCPLELTVLEEVDCGSYLRRFINYSSEPGSRVPAYLLIPKACLSGEKRPGILALHQTHAAGQKVVVGLGNSPDDEYGVELARRGYVCLAPAYPLLANYAPNLAALGYRSGTMKAIWDNIRGLDLLESLPYVRKGSFGAIGHSLGGHNGLFTAAFDPRIKVVVTSCGFDSFVDYKDGDISGWTSSRYMPALKNYRLDKLPFDFADVFKAIAPRVIFISAPIGDTNFKHDSVDRVVASAAPVYRRLNAEGNIRTFHPETGHRFPPEIRERAYRTIDEVLRNG